MRKVGASSEPHRAAVVHSALACFTFMRHHAT